MALDSLNVIALISGGKDSFHSLLHCLAQGHRIVALANLSPHDPKTGPASENGSTTHENSTKADPVQDDLNSHMYQTAGHALTKLYAEALPFPFFQGPILGTNVCESKEYAAVTSSKDFTDQGAVDDGIEDETESLTPLLRRIIRSHPECNALSTGAIQSTYQRTRIESVCARLGLISLAYLWQYDKIGRQEPTPDALLVDIEVAGLDARIVKVASGGLDETFLWSSLADARVRERVRRAVKRFGGSVLGEGGEYETLVVAGPSCLWQGKIQVDENDREIVLGGGGEAFLAFHGGHVVPNEPEDSGNCMEKLKDLVYTPELWDKKLAAMRHELQEPVGKEIDDGGRATVLSPSLPPKWDPPRVQIKRTGWNMHVSNLSGQETSSVQSQMAQICDQVRGILNEDHLLPSDIVFTTILLRSIADFAEINAIYGSLFTTPLPPARVTIAVGDCMPRGTNILLSFTATFVPRSRRRGLHVQSRSFWAPANIGPYSQAINVTCGRIQNKAEEENKKEAEDEDDVAVSYVAGQIPLVPASMQVHGSTTAACAKNVFLDHALLSLQHLCRIGTTMDVSWWTGGIAFLATDSACAERAQIAEQVWLSLHSEPQRNEEEEQEDEVPDLWEQRYAGQADFAGADTATVKRPVKLNLLNTAPAQSQCSWYLAVEVKETPRNCMIEWQSVGLVTRSVTVGMQDSRLFSKAETPDSRCLLTVSFEQFDSNSAVQQCLQKYGLWEDDPRADPGGNSTYHGILYTTRPDQFGAAHVQLVPCYRLWGWAGRALHSALVLSEESQM